MSTSWLVGLCRRVSSTEGRAWLGLRALGWRSCGCVQWFVVTVFLPSTCFHLGRGACPVRCGRTGPRSCVLGVRRGEEDRPRVRDHFRGRDGDCVPTRCMVVWSSGAMYCVRSMVNLSVGPMFEIGGDFRPVGPGWRVRCGIGCLLYDACWCILGRGVVGVSRCSGSNSLRVGLVGGFCWSRRGEVLVAERAEVGSWLLSIWSSCSRRDRGPTVAGRCLSQA